MKIVPQPGDYVSTIGMTEEQYHAVAKLFINAGADSGEYLSNSYYRWVVGGDAQNAFGVSKYGAIFHGGVNSFNELLCGRELSISDILGEDPAPWNGEGLPPVGTECEFLIKGSPKSWQRCNILYIGKIYCVYEINGGEYSWNFNGMSFRPTKSERDNAIEEMMELVKFGPEDGRVSTNPNGDRSVDISIEKVAAKFYDAGYRKVEK